MRNLTAAQIESMQYRRVKFTFAVQLQYKTAAWNNTGSISMADVFEYQFDKDSLTITMKDSANIGVLLSYYTLQLARIYITETITDGATVISEPSPVYFPYTFQHLPGDRIRILATALAFQSVAGIDPDQTVDDLITALGLSRNITPAYVTGQEWYDYKWGLPGPTVEVSLGELARNLGKRYMVEAFAREADVLFQNRYNSPNRIVDYTPFTDQIETIGNTSYNAPIGGISWQDEDGVLHESTGASQPIHHMGFVPSTATQAIMDLIDTVLMSTFKFTQWPDLRLENGDYLRVTAADGTHAGLVNVTHHLKRGQGGALTWEQTVEACQVPATVAPGRTPNRFNSGASNPINFELDTSNFSGNLTHNDQTVQTAIEALMRGQREKLTAARTLYVRGPQSTVTMTIASPCVVTWTAHTLVNGDTVAFTTSGTLPTGIVAGTIYYVVNKAANTFEVAATEGGASINTSGAQAGTHKCSTGNDGGDGLSTEYGRALMTIQEAVDRVAALDSSIYDVTIQLSASKYNESTVILKNPTGAGSVILIGNETTPANVVCDVLFAKSTPGTIYKLRGLQFTKVLNASLYPIVAYDGASIEIQNVDFSTGWTIHVAVLALGYVNVTGNYTISGGAAYHVYVLQHGTFNASSAATVTLTGTPAFSVYTMFATDIAVINVVSGTVAFSGAATGARYRSQMNSVIQTGGGGANYFPGNAAGSTDGTGVYA